MDEVIKRKCLTLKEIVDVLEAEVISNKGGNNMSVDMACSSDLMSDVLSFAQPGGMLLTGLITLQVIYTVELADINLVCFVRGKRPPEGTVKLAENKSIVLLRTNLPMFESCGRLYEYGLRGCSNHEGR